MSRQGWIKTVVITTACAALLLLLATPVILLLQVYSPNNVTMVEVPLTRSVDGEWSQDFHVMLPKNSYDVMFQFQPEDSGVFETPLRMSGEISVIASGGEVLLNATFDKIFEADDMERQITGTIGIPNPAQGPLRQGNSQRLLPSPWTFYRPDLENGHYLRLFMLIPPGMESMIRLPKHGMILNVIARLRVEHPDTAVPADLSAPLLRIGKFIDAV